MYGYLLMVIADVLLAASFVYQKKFQHQVGSDINSGFLFSALSNGLKAVAVLLILQFRIEFSVYSVIMALLQTICVAVYTLISFRILKKGSIAMYTLFLMSGGMTLPYLYGIAFLGESLTFLRVIGLVAIIASMIISDSGFKRGAGKSLLLCIIVFFLNGTVSIVSKLHQVEKVYTTISTMGFMFWTSFLCACICMPLYLLTSKKKEKNTQNKKHIRVGVIVLLATAASGLSYYMQLLGAVNIPASVLYPVITGGSIVFSAVAGVIAFGEKLSKRQIIGILICVIGTCLFI